MGPNGSGKSTLSYMLAGEGYGVENGVLFEIWFVNSFTKWKIKSRFIFSLSISVDYLVCLSQIF